MRRPGDDEHAPYYSTYIDQVPDRDVLEVLAEAPGALEGLLSSLPAEREHFAYAPGKWTIREVLGHVIDAERVFGYRAVHIARGDPAELPGMDQDDWAAASNAGRRTVADLLAEFRGLRTANATLYGSFDEEILAHRGVASEVEFTVRSLIYIIAGHEIHHRRVLEQRYLVAGGDDA